MNDGEGGKEQKDGPAARMSHVIGQTASGFSLSALVSHVAGTRALYIKTVVWLNYVVVARALAAYALFVSIACRSLVTAS